MSDVPSNLIPTRLTQLPVAPVADENSLMMIVYQGNNYQIRVGDLLSVAGVPTSTQVIAGTGMTGGGALTGNVTLSIANGGVGSVQLAASGVTSGVYGDATNIPVFTVDSTGRVTAATSVPATISGYVPTSTQVIAGDGLTGGGLLSSNVTLAANFSDTEPLAGFQAGEAGTSTTLARGDHQHPAVDLSSDDQVDNILGLGNGGTARSLVPDAGAIIWSGADGLYIGPVGLAGQVLVSGGTGEPTWGSALLVVDQPANVVYAGPAAGPDAPTSFRSLVNADLPASGVTANTYGSSTAIPVVTVNSKGVITSVTTASFTGGLSYQGSWNASTNTPTLTSSVGTNGYYYIVSVAGSTNLNGVTDWQVGDWAIFNGSTWQKIDQTNLVSSVNGQTGVVVLTASDVGAQPLDAQLTDIAGLTPSDNNFIVGNGSNFVTESGSTARTSLGLGSIATQDASSVAITGGAIDGTTLGSTTRAAIAGTTGLVGPAASANFTRFPNALSVISNTDVGIQQNETEYIGLIAEATANSATPATRAAGLYGVGYSQGGASGEGLNGEGHVSASSDTGSAVGVRGYANDTHSGGLNIGLYGNASGSSVGNYALYLKNGDIYSFGAQTWALNGNLTLSGSYTTSMYTLNLTNALGVAYGGTGLTSFTSGGVAYASSTSALATGSAFQFDGSNLGLGVVPSGAYANIKAFELGANGALMSETPSNQYNAVQLGINFYYDASANIKYKSSGVAASRYLQYQGTHVWETSTSAQVAGTDPVFSTKMTLDASGNLGIGTASPTTKLSVSGTVTATAYAGINGGTF